MSLSNLAIQRAKPKDSTYKMYDGKNLYLEITPSGSKRWRFKYRFNDKEKRISLGTYPEISLSKARDLLEDVRRQVAEGFDPSELRKEKKRQLRINQINTLETVARAWWASYMTNKEATHKDKVLRRFELYVFPYVGKRVISDLTTRDIVDVVIKVLDAGFAETAKRTLQTLGQVFRYAVVQGFAERDVTAEAKGLLPTSKTKNMATLLEPKDISNLLRSFDSFRGSLVVKCALELAPIVFARPGELRSAMWKDINFELKEWTYIVKKGGNSRSHTVPLSSQALEILERISSYSKTSKYVFPNARAWNRPMSEAAVNAALRSLGFDTQSQITGHGFRAMARTILHETLNYDPNAIEHQLSHTVPDLLGVAYNRTKFLDARVKMMQDWADYLDNLKGKPKTILYFDSMVSRPSQDIDSHRLISAGFTTVDGKQFYFETTDCYALNECSRVVREQVLPNLDISVYGLTVDQARSGLKDFIESFDGKVVLASTASKKDYQFLLSTLFKEGSQPTNLALDHIAIVASDIQSDIDAYFESNHDAILNHALWNAKALANASGEQF